MNPFIYQPEMEGSTNTEAEGSQKTVKPPPRIRSRGLSRLPPNSAPTPTPSPSPSSSRPELNKLASTKAVSGGNSSPKTRRMTMLLPPTSGNMTFLGRLATNNAPMPDPKPVEANDDSRPTSEKTKVSGMKGSARPPPPTASMLRKKERDGVDDRKGANSGEPSAAGLRSWKNSSVNTQFQSQQSANKPRAKNNRMSMLPPPRPAKKPSGTKQISNENNVDKPKQNNIDELGMVVDNNYNLEEDVLSAVASILNGDLANSMPSAVSEAPKEGGRFVVGQRGDPPSSNSVPVTSAKGENFRRNYKQNNAVAPAKDNVGRRNLTETQQRLDGRSPFRGLPIQTNNPNEPFLDMALEELLAGELSNASLSVPNSPMERSDPKRRAVDSQNQPPDEGQEFVSTSVLTSEESTRLMQMNGWDENTESEDEGDEFQNLFNNGWSSPVEDSKTEKAIMSSDRDEDGIKEETLRATMDKLENNDKPDKDQSVDVDDFMAFLASVASDLEASQDEFKSINDTLSIPKGEAAVAESKRTTVSSVASGPIVLAMAAGEPFGDTAEEEGADMIRFTPGEELIQSQGQNDQSVPRSPIVLKSLNKVAPTNPPNPSPAVLTPVNVPALSTQRTPKRSASLRNAPPVPGTRTRERSATVNTSGDIRPGNSKTPRRVSSINPGSNIAPTSRSNVTTVTPPKQPTPQSKSLPSLPSFDEEVPSNAISVDVPSLPALGEDVSSNAISFDLPSLPSFDEEVPNNAISVDLPSLPSLNEEVSSNAITFDLPGLLALNEEASSNAISFESDAIDEDPYTPPSESNQPGSGSESVLEVADAVDDDPYTPTSNTKQSVLASQSFLDKFNLLMASNDNSPPPLKSPNMSSSVSMDSNRDMESMI